MFRLSEAPIDPARLREALLSRSAGAFCAYEGWVRAENEGKAVVELSYSAYAALAPRVAGQIVAEASERFEVEAASIVHRVGSLGVGEVAVWVGVTARHRGDSFLACRYLIDNLKHRLPVWKKERYADGSEAWIENNHCGCADPANLHRHHSSFTSFR